MFNFSVYKITNTINQKKYIGSSIRVYKRWQQEKNAAFNPNNSSYNYPLSIAFRNATRNSQDHENTIVLVHSNFNHIKDSVIGDTIWGMLSCKPWVHTLTEDDIVTPDLSTLRFTSILKYKGLETNKVILVIPYNLIAGDLSNFLFEIYVGFTRAMMELEVIIHNN